MHDLFHLKNVLVVEDSFLIAIDLCAVLDRCGCGKVEMVSSVSDCLKRIASGGVDFATLDIELSDGLCGPIAEALFAQRIPFIYVSGFLASDYPEMPSAPWVGKPALDEELCAAGIEACRQFSPA